MSRLLFPFPRLGFPLLLLIIRPLALFIVPPALSRLFVEPIFLPSLPVLARTRRSLGMQGVGVPSQIGGPRQNSGRSSSRSGPQHPQEKSSRDKDDPPLLVFFLALLPTENGVTSDRRSSYSEGSMHLVSYVISPDLPVFPLLLTLLALTLLPLPFPPSPVTTQMGMNWVTSELSLLFAFFLPFEKFLRRPRWSSWSVRRPLLFDLDLEEKLVGQRTGGFKQRSPPSGELVGA